MKSIFILSSMVVALYGATGCNNSSTKTEQTNSTQSITVDTTKMKTGEIFYQCEMDPEVISDKEGTCSKCGMELTKTIKK